MSRETELNNINWKKNGVDIVLECTGKNNSKEKSLQHIKNGAKKVIVSAPCKNADKTIVYGVNHKLINKYIKQVKNKDNTRNIRKNTKEH